MDDDLITFLRARLDEDEELAFQAQQSGGAPSWDPAADVLLLPGLKTRRRLANQGVPDALQGAVEAHAARHDPARVLAEVDAKRQIISLHEAADHEYADGPVCLSCDQGGPLPYPCPTLRLLALPYADHPDYREEWTP